MWQSYYCIRDEPRVTTQDLQDLADVNARMLKLSAILPDKEALIHPCAKYYFTSSKERVNVGWVLNILSYMSIYAWLVWTCVNIEVWNLKHFWADTADNFHSFKIFIVA